MCGMLNDVPIEYFSPLDHEGVRQDIASRPELNGGSVEYIAPKEYMVSTSGRDPSSEVLTGNARDAVAGDKVVQNIYGLYQKRKRMDIVQECIEQH